MKDDAGYRKVYETLRKEILDGRYSAARKFPSSTALARRFGIARFTIRQALDLLVREGFVRSERGRGTFVTEQGASRRIGLMLSGLTYSEYFQPIATAIMKIAREAGYEPCFGAVQSCDSAARLEEARRICSEFIHNRVAGVIYHPLDYAFDKGETNRPRVCARDI